MCARRSTPRVRLLLALAAWPAGACDPAAVRTQGQARAFEAIQTAVLVNPCDSLPPLPDAAVALTGTERFDNEVHDCQRLVMVDAGGHTFGPLVGAYPLHAAMAIVDDAAFPAEGRAIATVFNWGSPGPIQHYRHLGIVRGWNCLFLRPTDDPAVWDATIVARDEPCEGAAPPAGKWNLEAFREPGDAASIPPSARWGWVAGRHYLGIRCAAAWCTIGPPGTQPAPRNDTARRRNLHPGWYDEQSIAVERGIDRFAPGPKAYIYPTDTLLALRGITDEAVLGPIYAAGLEVASIEVHGRRQARAEYQRKFNLSDELEVGRATVWIRIGADTIAVFRNGTDEDTARLIYLPNSRHGAAGAVRWRWREDDESAWISCKAGCCDVVER